MKVICLQNSPSNADRERGDYDQQDTFSMGSRGGSGMGSRGGSRVGSRGGSRAETPSSRPSTRPTTPDMDVLRALDDLDLMQQQKASEQRMGRAVNSLNMKTSIRHSLLLPINGNTKGKLLCGKNWIY